MTNTNDIEPKHGLKEIVTMSEQKDAPVNRPDEPWETITAYGNVEDMTLHPILRRAYRVACLIERAPHASIEQTAASSAAFGLVEELYRELSALIGKELLSRAKAAAYDILITGKPHGNGGDVSVHGSRWLIETNDPIGTTQYYCGPGNWCDNPNHAMKWPSKEAAEISDAWTQMQYPGNMRIAEHEWVS